MSIKNLTNNVLQKKHKFIINGNEVDENLKIGQLYEISKKIFNCI